MSIVAATVRARAAVVFAMAAAFSTIAGAAWAAPKHGRPFLTPREEVERIRTIVQQDAWAAGEYDKMRTAAEKGDGCAAGLFYAMEGNAAYAETAKTWLLKWSERTGKQYADWIEKLKASGRGPHQYYELDVEPALTFDRIHDFLDDESRAKIRQALENTCEYRLLYTNELGGSTPNLEFKPHWYAAVAGMALGNDRYADWGLRYDGGTFGRNRGGVLTVLAHLLEDGGVWDEANIYPIAHMVLPLTLRLCRYLQYYEGTDLFNDGVQRVAYRYGQMLDWPVGEVVEGKPNPRRAAARLFIDSFIGMAYPLEPVGNGRSQMRVATYGDGATGYPAAWNDLFLLNPAGDNRRILNAVDSLAYAWCLSGDLKYAGLLKFAADYKPPLEWYRPLPDDVQPPPAPSTVWPESGIAMLRADESPSYWTGSGLAVLHLMTFPYGHQHTDKLGITLHAFGRLLYPDYLPQQYQSASAGYTRQVPAHNTLCTDGQNIDFGPCSHRHDFTPEVKFHVTAAGGYPGVKLARALFLTREYLLDIFAADSNDQHDYDYLIHAIGNWQLDEPSLYRHLGGPLDRYWWFENVMARQTDAAWSVDFVQNTCQLPSAVGNFGDEWFKRHVGVRLTMAASPQTQVYVGDSPSGGPPDDALFNPEGNLPMLVARRHGRQAVFAVAHEPYQDASPRIKDVTLLASRPDAAFAMVTADAYTDWAFTALGDELDQRLDMTSDDGRQGFSGTTYGWMRLQGNRLVARGDWRGFRIVVPPQAEVASLTLNGKQQKFRRDGNVVTYAKTPEPPKVFSVSFPHPRRGLIAGMKNEVPVLVRNQTGRALAELGVLMDLPEGFGHDAALLRVDGLPPGAETVAALELNVPGTAAGGSLAIQPRAVAGTALVPVAAERNAWDILPPLAVRPKDELVRLPEKGSTAVTFVAANNTDDPLAATLAFALPMGVKTDPATVKLDPVPAHGSREFSVTFASSAESGWHTATCTPRIAGPNAPQAGLPFNFPLTVGAILKADYAFQGFGENLIVTPNYIMRTLMLNGASRYLVDGDGRLRYQGDFWNRRHGQEGPGRKFLSEGIINIYSKDGKLIRGWQESAGVLPFPRPAGQNVSAGASILVFFREDRIEWSFYRVWSGDEGLHFETGEDWVQLGGPAAWSAILVRGADGQLTQAELPQKKGDTRENVAAIELFFPGYSSSVAFAFPEPATVQFDGIRLRFDRNLDQTFAMGLIKPGTLEGWMKR